MSARRNDADSRERDLWFRAFREQSIDPISLGDGEGWSKPLGGGRSGASAALFLTTIGPVGTADSIVLKWDSLSKVRDEAEARRGRSDQADNVDYLRGRGASHIAFRMHPRRKELFGIIAYKYEGVSSPKDEQNVADFEELLQIWNATDGGFHDKTLRTLFENTITYFVPRESESDSVTPPTVATRALPDLKRDEYLKKARPVLRKAGLDTQLLTSVEKWWTDVVHKQSTPSFPDSRLVHGDPRFANILVDLAENRVTLIDFGAGERGRHVFHDLARFEVDLVFRTTAIDADIDRTQEIQERVDLLLREVAAVPMGAGDPRVRPVEIWRGVRDAFFPVIALVPGFGVRKLYALFFMNELLRRLKWHSDGNSDIDVGATVPELWLAMNRVLEKVPA